MKIHEVTTEQIQQASDEELDSNIKTTIWELASMIKKVGASWIEDGFVDEGKTCLWIADELVKCDYQDKETVSMLLEKYHQLEKE